MKEFLDDPLFFAYSCIVGLLVLATLIHFVLTKSNPNKDYKELGLRIRSWWLMAFIFILALAINKKISVIFFAFLSFLALKEYFSLIPTRRADRRVLFWAYLAIPIQYLLVFYSWYGMFIIFIPIYLFLFIPLRMILIGETKGFLRSAGTIHWGVMITIFSISHAAFLLSSDEISNPNGGGAALVFFLVVLTQLNDVFQFVWGKLFGKHKVVPTVSSKKTYEGLIGGVASTTILAWALAPFLTPFDTQQSLIAGIIIGLFGFIGDVTISAVKRDLDIKDSGSLLPGHGGILDRLDSLSYTAPLFFHFTFYFYGF